MAGRLRRWDSTASLLRETPTVGAEYLVYAPTGVVFSLSAPLSESIQEG